MRKTVLVTGSAKGIGKAIVEIYARNHYNVVINYLSSEKEAKKLEKSLLEQGFSAFAFCADVTIKQQVEEMIENVNKKFGGIDILVNNAGISQYKMFTDITEMEWDTMINVHLKGMYNCCKMVIPKMVSKKEGKIINISSMWGMVGASCEVSYSTAKAGIIGFTKALAKELGPSNIQVNCVAPGIIETDMLNPFNEAEKKQMIEETPLMRFGQVEDIANLVFYLSKEDSNFITGQVISSNGGFVI